MGCRGFCHWTLPAVALRKRAGHWTFIPMAIFDHEQESSKTDIANPAVIDLFALDQKSDEILLGMREPRPWDGSEERLHQLQEKFNAYVSFLLDGEMIA